MPNPEMSVAEEDLRRELWLRTRRGFTVSALALAAGAVGWTAFLNSSKDGRINRAMRRALDLHERVGRATFRASSRAREFARSEAKEPPIYGMLGLRSPLDIPSWRLTAVGAGGEAAARVFTQAQVLSLPRVEMTTEIRCVEGWSEVAHWSGVRLKDFAAVTGFASRSSRAGNVLDRRGDAFEYVEVETTDGEYYVGIDIESALHPQTLLCDSINGRPLVSGHGAPLRLVIPTKYGFKWLKQVGTVRFIDKRPRDFWAEAGYDWYAGL